MSDCIRMNGEDWVRWSWYEQRGQELNDRCADIPEAIRRDLLALARLAWIAEGATP